MSKYNPPIKLRKEITLKLLENPKFNFRPPFQVIIASAVICNYIQYGKIPIGSGKYNDEVLEDLVFEIVKNIYEERNKPIPPTNQQTPPNQSFIKKLLNKFRF